MNVDRCLPDDVWRLPTMMIEFDEKQQPITDSILFYNEKSGKSVSEKYFRILYHDGLANPQIQVQVQPLSLQSHTGLLHCNALVITSDTIERVEPRGYDVSDASQSPGVQDFYNPKAFDRFLRQYYRTLLEDSTASRLGRMINSSTIPTQLNYFRYYSPSRSGITSTDHKYKDATKCAQLTFDYLRLRVQSMDIPRYKVVKQWLAFEQSKS